MDSIPCYIILEDGEVIRGSSFGAINASEGEVGELIFLNLNIV